MSATSLRAIALLLIFFASLAFTGIVATASALIGAETADCCDREVEEGDAEPCAMADCPCFSCLTVLHPAPLHLSSPPCVSLHPHSPAPPSWHAGFAAAIDYPPEPA